MGVEVISPAMGKTAEDALTLADFEFSETGEITRCPEGHRPEGKPAIQTEAKEGRHTVAFNSEHCLACSKSAECPVKQGVKYHYLRYSDKQLRLAKRRQAEQEPEFKERYRYRAGVEASMSYYDRNTGVKRLRVRGLPAVRYCATLKAVGVNILRATALRTAEIYHSSTLKAKNTVLAHIISVFKEQFGKISSRWQQIFAKVRPIPEFELKSAA